MGGSEMAEDNGLAVTVLGLVLMALLILFLLGGCATEPIRLGPGECAVLTERGQIIVVGADCKAQRLYR